MPSLFIMNCYEFPLWVLIQQIYTSDVRLNKLLCFRQTATMGVQDISYVT
jgi:hypothetical protein